MEQQQGVCHVQRPGQKGRQVEIATGVCFSEGHGWMLFISELISSGFCPKNNTTLSLSVNGALGSSGSPSGSLGRFRLLLVAPRPMEAPGLLCGQEQKLNQNSYLIHNKQNRGCWRGGTVQAIRSAVHALDRGWVPEDCSHQSHDLSCKGDVLQNKMFSECQSPQTLRAIEDLNLRSVQLTLSLQLGGNACSSIQHICLFPSELQMEQLTKIISAQKNIPPAGLVSNYPEACSQRNLGLESRGTSLSPPISSLPLPALIPAVL